MTFADDDTGPVDSGPTGDPRGPRARRVRLVRAGAIAVAAAVAVPAGIAIAHARGDDHHDAGRAGSTAVATGPTVPAPSSPAAPSAPPSKSPSASPTPSASRSPSEEPSAPRSPSREPSVSRSPSEEPSVSPSPGRSESPSAPRSPSASASSPDAGRHVERVPVTRTKPLYRVATRDRVAFLTIDDGAYRDPEMTKILRDAKVAPTLFLTDQYAERDPDFFRDMRDATGGSIQNHTLDHADLKGKPYERQKQEICKTSDAYERDFGTRPTLLRPPYGALDATTMRAAADCGVDHVVHWSAEIQDGTMQFAFGDKLRSGDIVLMHFRKEFKADVAAFVDETRRAGLTPALLDDYLA